MDFAQALPAMAQRWLGGLTRPVAPAPARAPGIHIALVADDLTHASLRRAFPVRYIHAPRLWRATRLCDANLLLVESAWRGVYDDWRYRIAAYPQAPYRNNQSLQRLVSQARSAGITTVFWNKEDGAHFDRFIDSASLFDVVLTVDQNCLPRYRERLGPQVRLGVMPFAIEPSLHHPDPRGPTLRRACFAGSYSHHVHARRREWQNRMFRAAEPLGLTVYDRNSDRRNPDYRFPALPWLDVRPKVPHEATADIYRRHLVSLNVNTVDDSPTMFSRRLLEIMACGSLAVTNPSPSVDRHFRDFCEVVHDEEQCRAVFERLHRDGLSRRDRDRALVGADHIRQHHTWAHRIEQILRLIA